MDKFNYNAFLELLEEHCLLTSAWTGMSFDELPEFVQEPVEACVSELRNEFQDGIENT